MSWYEKDQSTPFDNLPLAGLWFLDGDMLALLLQRDWTVGQKYPQVVFPSGEKFDLWESGNPAVWGILHIFGEMDLLYRDTRDRAFEHASHVAEQCGYVVQKVGDDRLEVWGHDTDEHFVITYDNVDRRMLDVQQIKDSTPPPRPPLLPDEICVQLPELYSNEEKGLDAIAPVKFFTPDSNWTWYASEFDGKDKFFGLVVGFEIELGYFLLSELEQVRGPWGLPIERDLYFEPKTLRELQDQHRRERGE